MSLIYIGKKVPAGLREVGTAMHLGNGTWVFRVEVAHQFRVGDRVRVLPSAYAKNPKGTIVGGGPGEGPWRVHLDDRGPEVSPNQPFNTWELAPLPASKKRSAP